MIFSLKAEGKIKALTAEVAEIQGKYSQLEADFQSKGQSIEGLASQRLAELIAATGTPVPANVTSRGDKCCEELIIR
ncbi:MAG: hypothetical protein C5B47_03130 [Verrucomicrobia bacterium]|nr:MAG: hypothetical protein C5B47_03130 [Verrucomicrobiota bacterium]